MEDILNQHFSKKNIPKYIKRNILINAVKVLTKSLTINLLPILIMNVLETKIENKQLLHLIDGTTNNVTLPPKRKEKATRTI